MTHPSIASSGRSRIVDAIFFGVSELGPERNGNSSF